jgi:IS5 family transposase
VQGIMQNSPKKCAPTPDFVSQNQLVFEGFESPFEKKLNPENRWVVLAKLIPWERFAIFILKQSPKVPLEDQD